MRPARVATGVILALLGAIWFGQGIGLLPGGFMAGSLLWAVVGGALVALAIALLVAEGRRGR